MKQSVSVVKKKCTIRLNGYPDPKSVVGALVPVPLVPVSFVPADSLPLVPVSSVLE